MAEETKKNCECEEECSRDYGCGCDEYDYYPCDDCDCHCEWDE